MHSARAAARIGPSGRGGRVGRGRADRDRPICSPPARCSPPASAAGHSASGMGAYLSQPGGRGAGSAAGRPRHARAGGCMRPKPPHAACTRLPPRQVAAAVQSSAVLCHCAPLPPRAVTSKERFEGAGKDLQYGGGAMQGWRRTMEDAHIAEVGGAHARATTSAPCVTPQNHSGLACGLQQHAAAAAQRSRGAMHTHQPALPWQLLLCCAVMDARARVSAGQERPLFPLFLSLSPPFTCTQSPAPSAPGHATPATLGPPCPRVRAQIGLAGDESCAMFGVFDGHGGAEVAKFCQKYMATEIQQLAQFTAGDDVVEEALVEVRVAAPAHGQTVNAAAPGHAPLRLHPHAPQPARSAPAASRSTAAQAAQRPCAGSLPARSAEGAGVALAVRAGVPPHGRHAAPPRVCGRD